MKTITPAGSVFLYGYPHVARHSTGVHDDLLCSALYLEHSGSGCLMLANDLIFVGRELAEQVRTRINRRTGLPPSRIAICATHTHSGPVTVDYLSNRADPAVPKADPAYLEWLAKQIAEAGCEAVENARPAEIGLTTATVSGVGSNRHDPLGPTDDQALVLAVRPIGSEELLASAIVYAMHPTVLHEDSTLLSSDFPHFTREYLREAVGLSTSAPVLFLNGASGNQSPRHTARANTLAESRRLGHRLGECIAAAWPRLNFTSHSPISVVQSQIELDARELPSFAAAQRARESAHQRLHALRLEHAPRALVRTAECDVFGAEETCALVDSSLDGSLARAMAACLPAEIQVFRIGETSLVFWPGEFFVEYALEIRSRFPHTHVVTLANGVLQGYIVTPAAATEGLYEAGNAIFAASNGRRFIEATATLLTAPPASHATVSRD